MSFPSLACVHRSLSNSENSSGQNCPSPTEKWVGKIINNSVAHCPVVLKFDALVYIMNLAMKAQNDWRDVPRPQISASQLPLFSSADICQKPSILPLNFFDTHVVYRHVGTLPKVYRRFGFIGRTAKIDSDISSTPALNFTGVKKCKFGLYFRPYVAYEVF